MVERYAALGERVCAKLNKTALAALIIMRPPTEGGRPREFSNLLSKIAPLLGKVSIRGFHHLAASLWRQPLAFLRLGQVAFDSGATEQFGRFSEGFLLRRLHSTRFCSTRCREAYDAGFPAWDENTEMNGHRLTPLLTELRVVVGPPDVEIGSNPYQSVIAASERKRRKIEKRKMRDNSAAKSKASMRASYE
jgi:hypothetical protein